MSEPDNLPAITPDRQKPSHVVFISHSSADHALATSICDAFEASGVRCWIAPRDVQGGRSYPGQITQAIREARVVLLVLSEAANRSKNVLREVERGAHCQNHLLTFRVESIAPSDDLAYFIGTDQWVDGFQPLPVSSHFRALVQHARALLQIEAAALEQEEPEDAAAESFAHYRVLRRPDGSLFRIGKGGMGVTYKGIDTVLNRPVALKVIASELLRSPQAKQRFLREAQAAALVHDPHVATIFHFGQEGDAYFYAMEFVEGEDLERYVARQGPLAPMTALRVVLQVAQALEAAQARQLIHRDIKPGNIMAVANRTGTIDVKLIDFGLAKGAAPEAPDASRITRTQDFVGSPAFSSPEQCQTKKLDVRSDIYSLGVTLWYLISGKRPFSGSVGEIIVAQVTQPPPFNELGNIPDAVLVLLRRMLAKDPKDRVQTPEELQAEIEQITADLSTASSAVPEGIAARVAAGENELSPGQRPKDASAVMEATLASSLFDTYLALNVGELLADRYQLLDEEREGNGGRLFFARDQRAPPNQPSNLAIKLLHPGVSANRGLLDLLENELEVMRQAQHPRMVRYLRLERTAARPFLVREWTHGFLLHDLLRWRRAVIPKHLFKMLEPLAATLDFVTTRGLGLVNVSTRKILIACPPDIKPERFQTLALGDSDEWNRCELKLNPLCLAPLIFRDRNGWNRQTIVPTSQVLSITQAEAGIRGTKAVRLYGRLVYQILSGRGHARSSGAVYTPVPELSQDGNDALRRACMSSGLSQSFKNCQDFWDALNAGFAATKWSTGWISSSGNVAVPGSPIRTPLPPPPPKRKLALFIAAIVGGALVFGVILAAVVRFGGAGPKPTESPSPSIALAKPRSSLSIATPESNPPQSQIVTAPTPVPTLANPVSSSTASPSAPQIVGTPTPNPTSPKIVSVPTPTPQETQTISTPTPALNPSKIASVPTASASPVEIVTAPTPISTPPIILATPAPTPIPRPAASSTPAATSAPTPTSTPTPTNEQLAKKSLEQAYAEERKGDHSLAVHDYSEAIRLQPSDGKTYKARGKIYVEMKQYEKAIGDFTEAIRLKQADAGLYHDRAHAYEQLKEYEKAIADFAVAIRLEPGNASYYNERATVFEAMADKGRAEQDREKAEELRNPGHSPSPTATPTPLAIAPKNQSPAEISGSTGTTSFDGTWQVNVDAPNYVDPTGKHVRGFRSQFYVYVRNGVLHGEKLSGAKNPYPSPHVMDGKIQPDGSADLVVTGVSGDPLHNEANSKPGTPFRYEVKARFGGDHGTGSSVGYRPRAYTFVRRAR
jgi:serine/threonine protein kinase